MFDGVLEFYRDRCQACPSYGFEQGHILLDMIIRAVKSDDMLTDSERDTIINECCDMHIKMMEDNYNEKF